jgi:sterol desaturase/sphingolipid hydroxylase (fatty acid hydroxylase superfamily)
MKIIAFILGICLWTLAEYLMHRFLGHEHKGKNFFKAEHFQHHAVANYFAPAYKKMILAILVSVVFLLTLNLLLPFDVSLAFVLGFAGMYTLYERTHYRFHAKDPLAEPFIILRKHHFYHHFHNPAKNHGVTTRFWDRVFGTFVRVEKVKIPQKMSMAWLVSGDEIKPEYAGHFQLAKR